MSEIEIVERNMGDSRKIVSRFVKAFLVTAVFGVFFMIIWSVASPALASYPHYVNLFALYVWATLFFTFATRVSGGTIYKPAFVIGQAFFMILYFVYASNGGFLAVNLADIERAGDIRFTIEFMPLLALIIVPNLLAIAKGTLEMLEFTSGVPSE